MVPVLRSMTAAEQEDGADQSESEDFDDVPIDVPELMKLLHQEIALMTARKHRKRRKKSRSVCSGSKP
jgi:hypothetical protein